MAMDLQQEIQIARMEVLLAVSTLKWYQITMVDGNINGKDMEEILSLISTQAPAVSRLLGSAPLFGVLGGA